MASSGAPEDYSIQAEGMTIAVVYTRWNDKIVDLLRAGGEDAKEDKGAEAMRAAAGTAAELRKVRALPLKG